jgi:anaerobic selenocysteine-containing dehydrogenase
MKVNRRGFIKFAVGAVAGIHLTPLPWKTIDDVAIWTQNWPWVPRVTRYPELTYGTTVCSLCNGGCGLKVRLVDESKAIKAEGLPAAPVNQGRVCPMGAAGPQYQYGLGRFEAPLKRLGARGSGGYVKISWEEAFQEVGAKLRELRAQGKAKSVVMISGRRHDLSRTLAERFMAAYGSPNLVNMPGLEAARSVSEKAQFGWDNGLGYDLENAKYVLSFGCGLIEGWGAPVRSIQAFSGWRSPSMATKLVQVDSQATLTASKADTWLAAAPGTEAALALGLAHVIIKHNLYDSGFVNANTFGFDEFKALVESEYSPEQVSAITGLSAKVITRTAHEFAGGKPAVAIAGRGTGAIPTPVSELMAVMALNALVGNINQKGGVIVRKDLPLTAWPALAADAEAQQGLAAPRLDLAGSDKYPLSGSLLTELIASIDQGRYYPVEVLILDQADPSFFGADPAAFRRILSKIPLVVTLSSQADDTSIMADLVLPQTSNFEGPVEIINPPTLPYPLFGAGQAVFKSRFDTLSAGDIYLKLAEAVGDGVKGAMPFESHEDMVSQTVAGLFQSGRGKVVDPDGEAPGAEFGAEVEVSQFDSDKAFLGALQKGLFWYDPVYEFGDLSGAFKTPSGKFEFVSQTLRDALYDFVSGQGEQAALAELGFSQNSSRLFMPHFEPSQVAPDEKYPLLMVPEEQFKLVTDAKGNAPYLTKLLEETTLKNNNLVVHIHPETAEALHIGEGEKVWLVTRKGKMAVLVHLFDGARPEVIYAPIGLGHIGYGYYLRGKGANPMEYVEAKTDPLSGQALWWGTPAKLTKV